MKNNYLYSLIASLIFALLFSTSLFATTTNVSVNAIYLNKNGFANDHIYVKISYYKDSVFFEEMKELPFTISVGTEDGFNDVTVDFVDIYPSNSTTDGSIEYNKTLITNGSSIDYTNNGAITAAQTGVQTIINAYYTGGTYDLEVDSSIPYEVNVGDEILLSWIGTPGVIVPGNTYGSSEMTIALDRPGEGPWEVITTKSYNNPDQSTPEGIFYWTVTGPSSDPFCVLRYTFRDAAGNRINSGSQFFIIRDDYDDDGILDHLDACPKDPYNDADGDSICGDVDNCITYNPLQEDINEDGIGDSCQNQEDFYWEALPLPELEAQDLMVEIYTSAIYDNKIIFGGKLEFGQYFEKKFSIITWDGTNYGCLGSGLSNYEQSWSYPYEYKFTGGEVKALAEFQGNLIVGGRFSKANEDLNVHNSIDVDNLASWNGLTWEDSEEMEGVVSQYELASVNALIEYDNKLIVAGRFEYIGSYIPAGTVANSIAVWDGTNWSTFGTGCIKDPFDPHNKFGTINSMAVHNDNLYIVGDFIEIDGVQANNIAYWNGTNWSAIDYNWSGWNGWTGLITSFYENNGALIATGSFNLTSNPTISSSAISISGSTTTSLINSNIGQANCFINYSDDLIFGGEFDNNITSSGILNYSNRDANGDIWKYFGSGVRGGKINTMIEYNNYLFLGGSFMWPSQRIAKWAKYTCCIGIRGNVDFSPDDILDISDLVYLVDYMFTGGPAPECFEEADYNADGVIDITDLILLDDFMFASGTPTPPSSCD